MFKRGYENGTQTLEIYEGKVDLVLYNDKVDSTSFYFYRFKSIEVLGKKISKDISLMGKEAVAPFLSNVFGINYDLFIEELLEKAWSTNMNMRDEM